MTSPRSTDARVASSRRSTGCSTPTGIATLSSDIVAHLVFTHQIGMTNLLTRAGWQARAADPHAAPAVHGVPGRRGTHRA